MKITYIEIKDKDGETAYQVIKQYPDGRREKLIVLYSLKDVEQLIKSFDEE